MARLIAAGHASCDLPLRPVDKEVFSLDTVFVERVEPTTGGDALNVTVNLNKLGMGDEVRLVSVVGEDTFGGLITQELKKDGVDTSGIVVKPEVNSIVTCILIDKNNERHFIFSGNSARNLTVEDVLDALDEDTEYLHIGSFMSLDQLEFDNMRRLFAAAKERGIHTSFDVTYDDTGRWLDKIRPGLPHTDIFFASYDEGVRLSGGLEDPKEMAEFFKKEGVGTFVLKMGAEGCYATDFEKTVTLPAYTHLPVVDTTGAGDSFVAAYMFGVMRGFPMEECCLMGTMNGALAVSTLGANTGTGTVADFKEFLRANGANGLDAEALIAKL